MSHPSARSGRSRGPSLCPVIFVSLLLLTAPASAQVVVDRGERLDSDRPEAWAMAYLSAATLFSGFGPARAGETWSMSLGAEADHRVVSAPA